MAYGKCSVKGCGKDASDSLMMKLTGGAVGFVPLCTKHLAEHKDNKDD